MARERLSYLQRCILVWLQAHEQRFKGTMAADHRDLVKALDADNGNLSTSLRNLERKGLVTIGRTAGGKAENVSLTPAGQERVAELSGSCE